MGHKINFYKIFQNAFRCMGHRNHVTNFEKCYIFMILSPKIVFEETQKTCSLIMNVVHLCHTLFTFCKKIFNLYMSKG